MGLGYVGLPVAVEFGKQRLPLCQDSFAGAFKKIVP